MGIRDTGYRHWQGTYTGHAWRWWTITKQGLRATVHSRARLVGIFLFALVAWAPYFFFAIKWYFFGGTPINICDINAGRFAAQVSSDTVLRCDLYTLVQGWQVAFVPIFVAAVAAPLVANDLRSNALYIYLAKPVRRVDYIVGKVASAMIWAVPVTLVPSLVVWFAANATTDKQTQLHHATAIFWQLVFVEALVLVTVTLGALVLSSFTKRWYVALGAFLGGYFMLWLTSIILQGATQTFNSQRDRYWLLVSLPTNLINVARHVFEQSPVRPPAWGASLTIVLLFDVAAASLFAWRVLKLEVAE